MFCHSSGATVRRTNHSSANLFDIYDIHSSPPMATVASSVDVRSRCDLICCWCYEPKPDEWIKWQRCWCNPDSVGPNGGRTISVRTCIPVLDRSNEREWVVLMLQSKAKPRDKRGRPINNACYWYFICQECRKDARRRDPWYTV